MSTKAECLEAAKHWRKWSEGRYVFPPMAQVARDTAKALEIEAETGVAVCPCHFKPYPDPNTSRYDRTLR